MTWKFFLIVLFLAVAVGIVVDHTVTDTQIRTISDARSSNTQGGTVVLQGIITYAEDNTFILDDGTGKAELSTCPVWYKRIDLRNGDYVTVVGQVMNNPSLSMNCNFVLSVYKVFRDREVIQVRIRPGKPPWSSYRAAEP